MQASKHKKYLILVAVTIIVLTTGLGCKKSDKDVKVAIREPIELEFWGVFDKQEAFSETISAYQSSRPNVTIRYRKLRFEEYERELLNAWAEGRGPDLFMVHNTWIGAYTSKITPLPAQIKIPTVQTKPGLKPEKVFSFRKIVTPQPHQLEDNFAKVVAKDMVREGLIYGLPLSLDTLALYYNRGLLDQAGVSGVPQTWQELKEASQALTRYDADGEIDRAGVALGGANNINRSFDILSLLMAQNGIQFVAEGGRQASFAEAPVGSADRTYRPGQEALRFYTDFASPNKEVYTWSEGLVEAQELFVQGRLGMMLGYAFQLPFLRAQGPRVDLGIAQVPHINPDGTDATGETINWANYWALSAARATKHVDEVWDFVLFATTELENVRRYSRVTGKPAALRELITEQEGDRELGVFAGQVLTAQSWYRGKDPAAAEAIFKNMILSVTRGLAGTKDAIDQAERQIEATLK